TWATSSRTAPRRRAFVTALIRPRNSRRRKLPSSPLLLLQLKCSRIDAVTNARRRGAVREEVAQVAATVRAHDFGADHAVTRVRLLVDRVRVGRGVERRPAATRVVLRLGPEELRAAACAPVRAGLENVVVLT